MNADERREYQRRYREAHREHLNELNRKWRVRIKKRAAVMAPPMPRDPQGANIVRWIYRVAAMKERAR